MHKAYKVSNKVVIKVEFTSFMHFLYSFTSHMAHTAPTTKNFHSIKIQETTIITSSKYWHKEKKFSDIIQVSLPHHKGNWISNSLFLIEWFQSSHNSWRIHTYNKKFKFVLSIRKFGTKSEESVNLISNDWPQILCVGGRLVRCSWKLAFRTFLCVRVCTG